MHTHTHTDTHTHTHTHSRPTVDHKVAVNIEFRAENASQLNNFFLLEM